MAEEITDYSFLTIRLLSGFHDTHMVKEVAAAVEGVRILFLEMVADAASKKSFEDFSNAITQSAAKLSTQKVAALQNETHPYWQIVYELRSSGSIVIATDRTPAPNEVAQSLDVMTFIDNDDIRSFNAGTFDLEQAYQRINAKLDDLVTTIKQRDWLVASQVHTAVDVLARAKPDTPLEVAVVQGFAHNSRGYLEHLLPGVQIHQIRYGRESYEVLQHTPNLRLMLYKLRHAAQSVPKSIIYRYLLAVFSPELMNYHSDDKRTAFEILSAGNYDPATDTFVALAGKVVRSQDALSDEQVSHRLTVAVHGQDKE